MKCFYCKGEMKRGNVPFQTHNEGYVLTLQEAPAWICEQCGEHFFDMDQAKAIQDILHTMDEKTNQIKRIA